MLRGDCICVTLPGDVQREYRGYVHRVEMKNVLLKFAPHVHQRHIAGTKYNVRFSLRSMQVGDTARTQ